MSIKVVTFSDNAIKEYAKITEEINKSYCEKHDYNFKAYHQRKTDDSFDIHWEKVSILRDELKNKKNKFVVWIDADAAVNHHDVKFEDFVKANKKADIIISHDGVNKENLSFKERDKAFYVNSGVIIVKNTRWAREFVDKWIIEAGKFKKGSPLQDQDKLVDMLKNGKMIEEGKVVVLAPKDMNSEYENPTQNTFIWHLMKRSGQERKKIFGSLLSRLKSDKEDKQNPENIITDAYKSRYRSNNKKPSKVLIVMLYDDKIASYSSITEAINRRYAANHGYDLVAVRKRVSTRDPQWDCVKVVEVLMNDKEISKNHEWFFWIDSDAAFAKHEIDLFKKLNSTGKNFVICDDSPNKGSSAKNNGIQVNTGTFGFKNTPWSRNFTSLWWNSPFGKEKIRYHEQDAINTLYDRKTMDLHKNIKILDAEDMNSKFGSLGGISPADTFVVHMMAKPTDARISRFLNLLRATKTKGSNRPDHVIDKPDHFYANIASVEEKSKLNYTFWLLGFILLFLIVILTYRIILSKNKAKR